MNKVFLLYLMCVASSLIFLSAYFSMAFFDYIESVFYIISLILISSVFFIFLMSSNNLEGNSKLILLSFFFLAMNISLILAKNLFQLNAAAILIFSIFENFSFISFSCLMAVFSHSLNKMINAKEFVLLFSPLIAYSLLLVFLAAMGRDFSDFFVGYFILIFTIIYAFIISKNIFDSFKNSDEFKMKFFFMLFGIIFMVLFSGLRNAGIFFYLNSIFLAAGAFLFSFGALAEKSLGLYEKLFNSIRKSLPNDLQGKYSSWLIKSSLKKKGLMIGLRKKMIIINDNPLISNSDEMKMLDELLVFSIAWMKKQRKAPKKTIKEIKEHYNSQKMLSKKLSQFSF